MASDSDISTTEGAKFENWNTPCLKRLLVSGDYSDCRILAGHNTVYKVHILVLTQASAYFEKALCDSFKEAEDKTLDWSEHDDILVRAMLRFAYGHLYVSLFQQPEHLHLANHVRLYTFADMLDYKPLRAATLAHLEKKANEEAMCLESYQTFMTEIDQALLVGPDQAALLQIAVTCTKKNMDMLRGLDTLRLLELSRAIPCLAAVTIQASLDTIAKDNLTSDIWHLSPQKKEKSRGKGVWA